MARQELKKEFLRLLDKDEEFRYAVAGYLGFSEILRRLDRHEEELVRLRGEANKLREDMIRGFERHDQELAKLRQDLNKLREDMIRGFERHDQELAKLRQDLNKLREDMIRGFEEQRRHLDRRITSLGARWGLRSERAFREGVREVLESAGWTVSRWVGRDEEGLVYGYPASVEVDLAVKNNKVVLVEVKSSASRADVAALKRKALLYERREGRRPDKLVLIAAYADAEARRAARRLGVTLRS